MTRRLDLVFAVLIAGVALLAGWLVFFRRESRPAPSADGQAFFRDLVAARDHVRLVISGRLMAEVVPCGCKKRHLGGIARVATGLQQERTPADSAFLIEAGDSLFSPDSLQDSIVAAQSKKKAEVMTEFLRLMNPVAVALGEMDLAQPSSPALDLFAARGIVPVVTNATFPGAPGRTSRFQAWEFAGHRAVFCNLFSAASLSGIEGVRVTSPVEALAEALKSAGRADFVVLCCHRIGEEALSVLASQDGPPRILIDADGLSRIENPPGPSRSLVLRPADKGEGLLILDLYLARGSSTWFNMDRGDGTFGRNVPREADAARRSNLVDLRSRMLDASVPDEPRAAKLVAEYRAWLQAESASAAPATFEGPAYAGAAACGSCHAAQLANWNATVHAGAWKTLVRDPQGGASDPECVSCHVTGFLKPGGPRRIEESTLFQGVQCESCHAPIAGHPGGARHAPVGEALCRTCHSATRDPDFDFALYIKFATCTQAHDPAANRPPR